MHTWACAITRDIHVTHKLLMINSIVMKINLQIGGTRTHRAPIELHMLLWVACQSCANVITDDRGKKRTFW